MPLFPEAIQDFANTFVEMQAKRHEADYDPASRLTLSVAIADIDAAEDAMKKLSAADKPDRRAFAVFVLLKQRI